MKKSEIQSRINACYNELQQHDYTGRKVAFELAAAFKSKFPDVELPAFEQYQTQEKTAEERRAEIRELEKERENAEDERI